MARYSIFEGNIERLEKKLHTIFNKCNKYGCKFSYERVGEEYRELSDDNGEVFNARFIIVEAEGVAKINGWRFMATVEHTSTGNIIHTYDTSVEPPERYYTTEPICEHCNTNRRRNDTYLVYNEETDEWKQLGKSCLRDFTGGLDSETVTRYISFFEELIQGQSISGYCGGYVKYYPVFDMLLYAAECIKKFGFFKTDSKRSTAERTLDYYKATEGLIASGPYAESMIYEMSECNFNPRTEDNKALVESALEYVKNSDEVSPYFHNLRVICDSSMVSSRNIGILVSLLPTYDRYMNRKVQESEWEAARKQEADNSNHVGNIGDKVEFDSTIKVLTTTYHEVWGTSILYKFVDSIGNVYTWFTSKHIDFDSDTQFHIKGTVKGHSEYRGCKQTELTRCRVCSI